MSIRISAGTHTGLVRANNEDAFAATGLVELSPSDTSDGVVESVTLGEDRCLTVVADGLGGHPAGEVASRVAVDSVIASDPRDSDQLVVAVHEANGDVVAAMASPDGEFEMGTTLVALLINGDDVAVVNVGDSPAFEFEDGALVQLSSDDSARGLYSVGFGSSLVTQTLGGGRHLEDIEPHLYEGPADRSSRYLLCSDGLTNFVPPEDIAAVLSRDQGEEAVRGLIGLALSAGGQDNVTCILVERD